jgi:type IV pilus assembly protein PilB
MSDLDRNEAQDGASRPSEPSTWRNLKTGLRRLVGQGDGAAELYFSGDGGASGDGFGGDSFNASAGVLTAPLPERGTTSGFSPLDLRDRVAIMLLFKQIVTIEQVESVWSEQKQQPVDKREQLWRMLTRQPGVDRDKVYAEAAEVYAFGAYDVDMENALEVIASLRKKIKEIDWQMLRRVGLIPVAQARQPDGTPRYIFGAYDPTHPEIQRYARSQRVGHIEVVYVSEATINALIIEAFPVRNEYLEKINEDPLAYDLGTTYDREGLIDEAALDAEINRSTLINLFEATLVEAVRRGASDIHVWPNAQNKIEIHIRIDGELTCWHVEDRVHPASFLAVVKDNAINVDRFERDAGQDGFLQRRIDGALIRFRVSVMPLATANPEQKAESIVIRVLDDRKVVTDFEKLGITGIAKKRFTEAIRQPHGMVIMTGPTGSGKSTTLYAALHQVVSPKVNVLTIEDPVEYVIPAVRQIKLTHRFTLEDALRSILRHDPDIVMIGEMRDLLTADLAIKLANTGHLTFSTLHTNDAPSAVSRLFKMGIEPFLIAYAINLVVAQRLIRTLCPDCKVIENDVDPEILAELGFDTASPPTCYHPGENREKCATCAGVGYRGRQAITETMQFSKEVRRFIVKSKGDIDEEELREIAERSGMVSLRGSARELVADGATSLDEMIRVTAGEA